MPTASIEIEDTIMGDITIDDTTSSILESWRETGVVVDTEAESDPEITMDIQEEAWRVTGFFEETEAESDLEIL
jgi:hypothetical protein